MKTVYFFCVREEMRRNEMKWNEMKWDLCKGTIIQNECKAKQKGFEINR